MRFQNYYIVTGGHIKYDIGFKTKSQALEWLDSQGYRRNVITSKYGRDHVYGIDIFDSFYDSVTKEHSYMAGRIYVNVNASP